jgi:hypothetical protein
MKYLTKSGGLSPCVEGSVAESGSFHFYKKWILPGSNSFSYIFTFMYVSLKTWNILTCCYQPGSTLQTRLDLYDSELALASSPVLFWNLCVQLEIWISIVICGVDWQLWWARPVKAPPPPFSFSSLFLRDSCQLRKRSTGTSLTPSQCPTLDYGHNLKEIVYSVSTLIRKTGDYLVSGNRTI